MMKVKLLLIAVVAVAFVQSTYAARFRIVNKARQIYDFKIDSTGLPKNKSVINVENDITSDTIDTGLHSVRSISWTAQGRLNPSTFTAIVNMPAVLLGGRFTVLDTEGNYEYDFGIQGKGRNQAKKN